MIREVKKSASAPPRRRARPASISSSRPKPSRLARPTSALPPPGAYPTRSRRTSSSSKPRPARYSRAGAASSALQRNSDVEGRRPVEQAPPPVAGLAARQVLGRLLVEGHRDAEALGQRLDGLAEGRRALLLAHPGDRVAAHEAAVAVVAPEVRRQQAERGRALLVEGAAPPPAPAAAHELDPVADQLDEVRALAHGFDAVGRDQRHVVERLGARGDRPHRIKGGGAPART